MIRFKDFKSKIEEGSFIDPKGNLVSDETNHDTYIHSADADAKLLHIASMYDSDTFEKNLFEHLLDRKFNISIFDKDVYHSLATALRDKIIDENDISEIYQMVNSKDLDTRTENYKKLIQFIDDLKHDKNYDFDKLVNNICKNYKLNREPLFIDTLEKAMDEGLMDIMDLRNVYNAAESPIYTKKNESKNFPKASNYDNLATTIEDVEIFKTEDDKIKKVDLNEYDIVKIIDIMSPKEVQKIEEMQVLNLGTTMPKDLKRGDTLYLTVMLQPKNKTVSYNVSNTMGVVRVRVMDIYQGLNILKNKGLL